MVIKKKFRVLKAFIGKMGSLNINKLSSNLIKL
jgi:hypothetical protein